MDTTELRMATRFDRVTTTTRITESEPELDLDLDFADTSLARSDLTFAATLPARDGTRHVRPARLGGALVAWFAAVFGLCYVAGPLVFAALGFPAAYLLGNLWYALPVFASAAFVTVVLAVAARPRVQLDWRTPRDPVVSAAVGGLATWAIIQNSSEVLLPFSMMGWEQMGVLVGLNVVEATLLGMVFASFTRRRPVALALGAGFQVLWFGLFFTFLALVL